MDQRKILVKDFEKKIEVNKEEIRTILIKTGDYLFKNCKKDARASAQDDYDAAKKQLESRQQYEQSKDRINVIVDRLTDVSAELTDIRVQTESIERGNQPVYELLGEKAYQHLRKDPARYNQFSDVFIELNNQIEDIENIELDISNIKEGKQERKFFEKIADTGQVTYLKGMKMIRSKTLPRLYREAGKKLAETSFLETTGNEEVLKAARPYLQNKEKLDQLQTRKEQLENEKKDLESELFSFGVDKRSDRRIEELNRNIESADENYRERIYNIAVKVREEPPAAVADKKEFKDYIESIGKLEKQNEQYKENITKLNAAIEADNLARQIERMKENIEDHKRRIKEHERDIEDLKQRISESEAEKKRYEEIRGPEEITLES